MTTTRGNFPHPIRPTIHDSFHRLRREPIDSRSGGVLHPNPNLRTNVVTPGVTTLGIRGSILWACCAHNMQCNPWRAHGLYHPSDVSAAFSTLPPSSANVHESAGSAESAKLPPTARRYSAGGAIRRALPDSRGEYLLYIQFEVDSNDVLLKFPTGGNEICMQRTRTPRGPGEPLVCPSDVTYSSSACW